MYTSNNSRQAAPPRLVAADSSAQGQSVEVDVEVRSDARMFALIEGDTVELDNQGNALRVYITSLTECTWCKQTLKGNNETFFCSTRCERAYHRQELRSLSASASDLDC